VPVVMVMMVAVVVPVLLLFAARPSRVAMTRRQRRFGSRIPFVCPPGSVVRASCLGR